MWVKLRSGGVAAAAEGQSTNYPSACYAGALETSISREIDATKVSVSKHFGHSKLRESKPGLSGSMIRKDIIAPHLGHRGLLIESMNIAESPIRSQRLLDVCRVSSRLNQWTRFAQILCSEGDECLESDGCLRSDHETSAVGKLVVVAAQENEICAMFATRRNSIVCHGLSPSYNLGVF
jgi:hypothetical protein